jgi:hypothetical protein
MADKNRDTVVADEPRAANEAPRRASDELLPLDPGEGQGQRLSDAERMTQDARAELEAARAAADQAHRDAQMNIRAKQRELAQAELDKQRAEAMSVVEEQDRQNEAKFQKFSGAQLHPAYLEMEGARVRAMADALQQDETVPGGCYIVDGRKVDADGNPLE